MGRKNRMILSQGMAAQRGRTHDAFANKIAYEGLWHRLGCFEDTQKLRGEWVDLVFTSGGVIPSKEVPAGERWDLTHLQYEVFVRPNVMLLGEKPWHLRIVQARNRHTNYNHQKTEGQIARAREYIRNFPQMLCNFLEQKAGMSTEGVYRLTVGFSEAVSTKAGGLVETVYNPVENMADLLSARQRP
jgi:hypothetical protein